MQLNKTHTPPAAVPPRALPDTPDARNFSSVYMGMRNQQTAAAESFIYLLEHEYLGYHTTGFKTRNSTVAGLAP